jgi:cytochrome c biogenesis protein CcdA
MAGIASFFSPCSFPLLLTLLARETGKDNSKDKPVQWKAFRFAIALSLGASLFLIGTGLVIAAGGAVLFSGVTFASPAGRLIRTVVGAILIGLGLIQLGVFRINFDWVYQIADPILKTQAKIRRERPGFGFAVFGFGYLLAGFG